MTAGTYSSSATGRMKELEGTALATFGRRAAAFCIDFFLVAFAFALVVGAGTWIALQFGYAPTDRQLSPSFDLTNWYTLLALVIYHGVLVRYWDGQSVGKRLMRIRVVSATHHHISLWHAVERALGYGASTLELGFGFLQYFIADNRQTTHDRIAGTIVVAVPKTPTGNNLR